MPLQKSTLENSSPSFVFRKQYVVCSVRTHPYPILHLAFQQIMASKCSLRQCVLFPYAAIASATATGVFLLNIYGDAWPLERSSRCPPRPFFRPSTLCFNLRTSREEKSIVLHESLKDIRGSVSNELRTRQTSIDDDYRRKGVPPEPSRPHVKLPVIDSSLETIPRSGILVIGDVHGCYDEMLLLYEKAIIENDRRLFDFVVLVGDVCNKGPKSIAVIRHLRKNHPRWLSVRGNHEHSVLKASLGLSDASLKQSKYSWLVLGDEGDDSENKATFSDEDLVWMANLPYTIRIPNHVLREESDIIIVHAGLIPGVHLEDMDSQTFMVLRDLKCEDSSSVRTTPWASLWTGPEQVIFGHDAKRGFQKYEHAVGLDTGCVYGKKLTGIILPQRKTVQVNAYRSYVPIIEKRDTTPESTGYRN
jgi:Calcineurin-like phosphoesterase